MSGNTESTAADTAAANCRDHLIAARADAALWAGIAGLGTNAADEPMWLVTAIEAVLADVDRMTGTDSTDWRID